MDRETHNPLHQPETEFHGEVVMISETMIPGDDPRVQGRIRRGRPKDIIEPDDSGNGETPSPG